MPQVVGYIAASAATSWATAAGYSAVQVSIVGALASYAASSIASGLMGTQGDNLASTGALTNKASNNAAVPVVYGSRKIGATRVYLEVSGTDNAYLHQVLVIAEGEINAINTVYLNDVDSTDSRFNDLVTIVKKTGTDGQAAVTSSEMPGLPDSWTSAHKLSGLVYVYIKMKWDQDAFPRGVPTITFDIDGKKTHDPRTGTATFNNNPALAVRDYLTNTRYGRSIPTSQIDDAAIIAAANYSDAMVTKGGVSAARYTCDGLVDTTETSLDILNKLLSSCRGFLVFTAGVYKLVLDKPESAVFTFSEDNIVGSWSIVLGNKATTYNRITAKFFNPERNWQLDQAVIDSSTLRTDKDSGLVLERQTVLPFTSNIYTAKQIATINLNQSRQAVSCSFTATIEALRVEVGDVVYIKHDTPGWTDLNTGQGKLFRVMSMSLQSDDEVAITCREYDSTVYDFGTVNTVDATPNTSLPDPTTVAPITNLSVTPGQINAQDGTVILVLDIAWTAAADIFVNRYDITITISNGDIVRLSTQATSYKYQVLDQAATYTASIKSVNSMGVSSPAVTSAEYTPIGDVTAPDVPANITVNGTFKKIILSWDNPAQNDFSYVEIKRSVDAQELNAVFIGTTSATTWIDDSYNGTITRYYWIRSLDTSGNASAWAAMGSATTIKLDANDFDDGVITPDFIDSTFTSLIAGKATVIDVEAAQADIVNILNEQQSVGNTIDTVAERMLTLATTQSDTLGLVSDAGITVDPATGAVTIQAVETLRSQTETTINNVQIDLDAAEASLNLKASTTYVNNTIAAAVLDASDLAALNDLEAKVAQAEIDIDGAEAALLLKADETTVSGMNVRLDQAEIDIDGAEAAILLKASSTELDTVSSRVTTAETTINALDLASIANTVTDTRGLFNKSDVDDVQNLAQLLDVYKSREAVNVEIAYARNEISADVRDANVSIATSKLELAALINNNAALVTSEQTARADADSALASSITTLTATVGDNAGAIATEQTVRANADSAMATSITNLTSTVGDNTSAIVAEQTARTTADTALASDISGVTTTLNNQTASIAAQAISIDGVKAQYTVTIDNNGHVSGFGLVSSIINGVETSSFTVNADQFAIGSGDQKPFVYYANDTTIIKNGIEIVIPAGAYLDTQFIQAKEISADKITIDGNIRFDNANSGVQFGKTSLADTTAGAFFGRSGNVAGFNISSANSGIYADSDGTVALNNVRLYAGEAGTASEFTNPGTTIRNISSLTTTLLLEIVGGGGAACNNASGAATSSQRAGTSGADSYIRMWTEDDGPNGSGVIIATFRGRGGAGLSGGSVGSNTAYPGHGTNGQASSKAPGGTRGLYNGSTFILPGNGSLGSGGGGGANGSNSSGTPNAPVIGIAQAGSTFSQLINKPSNCQSIEIYVGAGGVGGQAFPSSNIVAGGNGGDGYASYADNAAGGIEVDLIDILARLTALEG